jgi:Tol biopolymer transport system component
MQNERRNAMKKLSIMIAILAIGAFCFGNLAAQNGYDLFQKALAKERGEGNLVEAIALYQKVIEETKDESLAAKAQLRIGICYEKLGEVKAKLAQEAFQKVVDNYPRQVDEVKVAREKLSGFLRARTLAEKNIEGLSLRHLLMPLGRGEDFGIGEAISPDGRFFAYFDYNVGAVGVYELTTGKKQILKSKIEKEEPWGETWQTVWSPDSQALLCNWWQTPDYHWSDLRIIRLDGTEQRILFRSQEYDEVYPMDWSSDGSQVLATFYKDFSEGKKIGLISVKGGSERILKTSDPNLSRMQFSPDGGHIAYEKYAEGEFSNRDISILSADGKVENPLVTHPAHDSLVGWSPDGKYVLFTSDRTGTIDLWMIPVEDGKAAGKAQLIKEGLGKIDVGGITQNGSFYYISSGQMEDIYVAELDMASGKINKSPEKTIFSQEGSNSWPQYSPDGKSIVCVQGGGIMAALTATSLCVRSLENGAERKFALKMQAQLPRWSPDGQFIYFTSYDRPRHRGIYRLELKTGQVSPWGPEDSENKPFGNVLVGISPDGKKGYYIHTEEKDRFSQLVLRDLESGAEKELFCNDRRFPAVSSLSPDGKWVAVTSRQEERAILIVPSEGGEPRELCRFILKGGHPNWLDWTPDSQSIVFSKRIDESKSGLSGWGLYLISVDGGDPQFLGISTAYISDIDVHPDGKHLAFASYGPDRGEPKLWVMENFLPDEKARAKGGEK